MPPQLPPVPAPVPSKVRRKGRWFHPASLRFWLVTLPVLFWAILVFLMFWPGLSFDWELSDRFFFSRNCVSRPNKPATDSATLGAGPFVIMKTINLKTDPTIPKGFQTLDLGNLTAWGYFWDDGMISLNYQKE